MFVSHDKNVSKKKFQKPNILRRKSKIPILRPQVTAEAHESVNEKSLVTTALVEEPVNLQGIQNRLSAQIFGKQRTDNLHQIVNKSPQKLISNAFISEENMLHTKKINRKGKNTNDVTIALLTPQHNNNQDNYIQNGVNVESFLVGGALKQNGIAFEGDGIQLESVDKYDSSKWCSDVIQDTHKVIKGHSNGLISHEGNMFLEQKLDVVTTMVPLSVVSSMHRNNIITIQGELVPSVSNIQNNTFNDLTKSTAKFKCDISDCNKEFSNKQKFKKHQNTHNKGGSNRTPRQTILECPIKALKSGIEEPCGKTFVLREELLKHLNEEHTLEEANHVCAECGRRFFWASGLRAHGRAHGRAGAGAGAGRGALTCGWPGCGRVFRQPCRLREHTRAHTGDKPYPCNYPNCGWSFRTASKLVRHARRHTGERRHACTACGRAFLRREHLREHHARQHAPRARPPHACTHPGCQQSFNNMSSLYMHMKKVHKKEETSTEKTLTSDATTLVEPNAENTFTVSLLQETPVQYSTVTKIDIAGDVHIDGVVGVKIEAKTQEEPVETGVLTEADAEPAVELEEEQHAARTHCTWPLLPRAHCAYGNREDTYVLEEDVQVEQSESSENNIYTVRSDLFLHGNVLTNEDSESMGGGVVSNDTTALSDDLDLLDAHPTIDLMQEELMYTDAVDESSFRVFLLSGEDLA